MKSFASLTFVTLTIYGRCTNSIPFYTNITSHAHGVQHLNTFHLYLMSGVLESSYSEKRS